MLEPRGARRLVLALLTAVVVTGALELFLAATAALSTRVDRILAPPGENTGPPPAVADARLGHRPSPRYPGHDRRGFRNPAIPDRADIVVLGDSQSYGAGVETGGEWPRRLEALTGSSVYNMAYGGYGPAHSLVLWDEAMSMEPRAVIEAFYAGNDLFDAFDLVHNKGQLPFLRSRDIGVEAAIAAAEAIEPITRRVERLFNLGEPAAPPPDLPPVRAFLSRHSGLYALARRARHEIAIRLNPPPVTDPWHAATEFARAHAAYCTPFEKDPLRTVFTPEYRLTVLDHDDIRIAEGERIAVEAIREMARRAAAAGIRFAVLLIPTKELAFAEQAAAIGGPYADLIDQERRHRDRLMESLARDGIVFIDALPALRGMLAAGEQPYPVSHDGHPNAAGHMAIARLVSSRFGRATTP